MSRSLKKTALRRETLHPLTSPDGGGCDTTSVTTERTHPVPA